MDNSWLLQLVVPTIVGFAVWYSRSVVESIRQERERLHESRRKIYLDLLEPFITILSGVNDPEKQEDAVRQISSIEFRRTIFELGFLGSDDVNISLGELMQYFFKLEQNGKSPEAKIFMLLWGDLLLSIRRDLGSKGTKLTNKDMLRPQIRDIDEI